MALPEYPVYRALTRPALNRLGIPQIVGLSIVAFTVVFIQLVGRNNLLYGVVGIFLFLIARALTEWDPNFFNILSLWSRTKAKALSSPVSRMWGGSMLNALPVGVPSDPEDIAGAV